MDDLTLLRDFRAERADRDPRAHAGAWRALEAKFDPASTGGPPAPARLRRRGLLALAGTAALVAIAAGVLILSVGRGTEPAVAEVLRRTAVVAAAADAPAELPGPGQFLYAKTKTLELEGWVRGGGPVNMGGPLHGLHTHNAFTGLIPKSQETWTAPDGSGRNRETVGRPQFLSSAERSRWERVGSPLPGQFDPSDQDRHSGALGHLANVGGRVLELRRGVIDTEHPKPEGVRFPDVADLPTDPQGLRRALRTNRTLWPLHPADAKPLDTEEMIWRLWGVLGVATAPAAVRAAAFNALAELRGITLDRDATDLVGRKGDAIRYFARDSGIRIEYIFDPKSSRVLGQRAVLVHPGRTPLNEGLPAGLAIRDVAYLQSKVVDSTRKPKLAAGPHVRPAYGVIARDNEEGGTR